MAKLVRSWWGNRFIEALESFTESNRLSRGRSYANGNKVKSFTVKGHQITAEVRGRINPYFGVYKEPLYKVVIELEPIPKPQWTKAIQTLSANAGMVSKLMMNEVPEDIEQVFDRLGVKLLPQSSRDFTITSCSCPDYSNPCKHIAGVYYLVAAQLDEDPFLLFELRGLSKAELQKELKPVPLGQALSAELGERSTEPEPVESLFTRPGVYAGAQPSLHDFWQGAKRLPPSAPPVVASGVAAIQIKKQGDNPAFWHQSGSFIAAMEDLYARVKTKNKDLL
jgi:uncharacterized Zn finger protein